MVVRLLLAALALLLWSFPSTAQTIRALIMDPTTGGPAPGGYVLLLDGADTEIARVLNGDDGLLAIRAPAPGNYRLSSVRVGFHPSFSEAFAVAAGETVDLLFDLAHEPIDFSTLATSDENVCAALDDPAGGPGSLWAEITKALNATQWAGRDGLEYYSMVYERDVEPAGRRVLLEQSNVAQGLILQTTETAGQPFIVIRADGGIVYNPPSMGMLLSAPFVNDYCFRVERTEDVAAMRFEPKSRGEEPGITGVLSVSLQTGHLTDFTYRFFNVPFGVGEDEARGSVSFIPGPSSRWLADAWVVRTPLVGVDDEEQYVLAGIQQLGGQLVAAVRGEEIVYSGALTEITGVVADGPDGAPLAGAEVEIVGTNYAATTDEAGNFRIAGPLDGAYALTFNHPALDSLGLFPPDTVVVVDPGEQLTLALQPLEPGEVLRGFVDELKPEMSVVDRGHRPTRTRNVITREHLASMQDLMCLEIIQRLRADWLQDRGTVSFGGAVSDPVVLRNGQFIGTSAVLAGINPAEVDEIWYFNRIDATQRWGSRFGRSVIEVHDRARR